MFICKFCSKICKNDNSLRNHERLCKLNPDRQAPPVGGNRKGLPPWNKGLTKSTDNRVQKNSINSGMSNKGVTRGKGFKRTEEQKQKLSIKAKERGLGLGYHGRGWAKCGWYKGFWCDSSWELAWIIFQLEHNIPFTRNTEKFEYIHEGKTKNYIPDFILVDGTYVEIKGYVSETFKSKLKYFTKPIVVIDVNDIKPYLDYVVYKYGKDYIKLYEVQAVSD